MAIVLTPLEKIKPIAKPETFPIEVYGRQTTITIFGTIPNPINLMFAVRYGNGKEDILTITEFSDWCHADDRRLIMYAKAASPVVIKYHHDHLMELDFYCD